MAQAKLALDCDPLSSYTHTIYGLTSSNNGHHTEAIQALRRAVELDAVSYLARGTLFLVLHQGGFLAEAVTVAEVALAMSGRHSWSYGDALAAMLATPSSRIRSVLTVADSGPSDPNRVVTGHLADATGAPIAGAPISLSDIPSVGTYGQFQLSGQAPAAAAQAIVGFRINSDNDSIIYPGFWFAGPDAANFSLYQVSYVQPADGLQRVPNGDFGAGAISWTLQGQTQIVSSDRGPGQMAQVIATADQLATLDSVTFPVTPNATFQFSCFARIAPSNSGYFFVTFLDASGNSVTIPALSGGALRAEMLPISPAKVPRGSTTTDSVGNFQFSLTALGMSQVTLEAVYAGDTRHWPGYAQTAP